MSWLFKKYSVPRNIIYELAYLKDFYMYINRYSRKYEDVEQTYAGPVTRGSSACTQSPSTTLQFLAISVLYKCNCMWKDREADGPSYSIKMVHLTLLIFSHNYKINSTAFR